MAQDNKRRRILSYENMSADLAAAFAEKYPNGSNDYLQDLTRYTKPDGTPFFAVTLEMPDSICLIKIQVEVDDVEDLEKWLEGEMAANSEQVAGATPSADENSTLPDDNISQYGSGEDDN